MKRRMVVFAASVIGAAAISAGVVIVTGPLGSANAVPSSGGGTPSAVSDMLDEMAPGAVVGKQADDSISVQGRLTPAAQLEIRKATELANSGPNSIRCEGSGATVSCSAVLDRDVIPALKAGETLYGRTVYRSIPTTERTPQLFQVGELVCGSTDAKGAMSCSRVERVQPVIRSDETMFVTYKPYNVTFDEQGGMTGHLVTPTVRLVRVTP